MGRLFVLAMVVGFVFCSEDPADPSGPSPGTREWLVGTWDGDCYSWSGFSREEVWVIADSTAVQTQYYCGNGITVASPQNYEAWEIRSPDTLRFYSRYPSNYVTIPWRVESDDGVISFNKLVEGGRDWVRYVRE